MPNIKIDDKTLSVEEGALLIEVMLKNGISIPHFCYHEALGKDGNCRMCMVEIEGQKRPQIACDTPVKDGMVVRTKGERIEKTKKGILELELINHPLDCPVCDQAGECKLQDYYMEVGLYDNRVDTDKVKAKKHIHLGKEVMLDQERCVLCKRCVRFTQIYTKTNDLVVEKRSDKSVITTFPGAKFENDYTGNVVDLCPVGALTDRDFRFKKRVWFLEGGKGLCMECSRGCNIRVDHHKSKYQDDTIYRFKPVRNDIVNGFFICDHGRYSYKKENEDRLFDAFVAGNKVDLGIALKECEKFLEKSPLLVISPSLSLEEMAYIKIFSQKRGLRVVVPQGDFIDKSFKDGLLKTEQRASNFNGASLIGLEIVDDLQKEAKDVKSIVSFGYEVKDELLSKDVVCFCTQNKNTTRYKIAIPMASTYEKSGLYINCDWVLQKSEKIVEKNDQPRPLLEMLSHLEKEFMDEKRVFEKYLKSIEELKDISIEDVENGGCYIKDEV